MYRMALCTKCGVNERYYKFYCKSCKKTIDAASYQKNREARLEARKKDRGILRAWLNNLKDGPCVDCGGLFPFYMMEWDHLPRFEKSFDICMAPSKRLALEEIKKCELVCANCHRGRTFHRASQV